MDGEIVDIKEFQKYVKSQMTDYRFKHTLGVVETAKDLAAIYGVDPEKTAIAALFHDLAKEFPVKKKKELCLKYNICIDDFFSKNIGLTHGAIAAALAKEEYDIQDKDIINAINNHTFGGVNMSDLERIIYLADMIEPNREANPELENLRKIAYENLEEAIKFALAYSIAHLKATNKDVHPMIYSMIKEYNEKELEEIDERI